MPSKVIKITPFTNKSLKKSVTLSVTKQINYGGTKDYSNNHC